MNARRGFLVLTCIVLAGLSAPALAQDKSIVVSSTTSTTDTGLFNHILPIFKAKTSIDVKVVADQIRSQGYACTNPSSAQRIAVESAPEEPVYLLICENATYQVRLIPDQAAKVTEIK